jgi:hypothetical protein
MYCVSIDHRKLDKLRPDKQQTDPLGRQVRAAVRIYTLIACKYG